jgi:hypothetical protein
MVVTFDDGFLMLIINVRLERGTRIPVYIYLNTIRYTIINREVLLNQ